MSEIVDSCEKRNASCFANKNIKKINGRIERSRAGQIGLSVVRKNGLVSKDTLRVRGEMQWMKALPNSIMQRKSIISTGPGQRWMQIEANGRELLVRSYYPQCHLLARPSRAAFFPLTLSLSAIYIFAAKLRWSQTGLSILGYVFLFFCPFFCSYWVSHYLVDMLEHTCGVPENIHTDNTQKDFFSLKQARIKRTNKNDWK